MTDEIENNSAKVWGVELDGKILNTPLRTYTEARKQAHRVAQCFADWVGIRVVKEEAQEDQLEAGQVYSRVISEGGIGLGKSSVTKDPQAESVTFDCTRNENQNGDTK